MKHVCMLLAGAGLIAASGTIAAAEDGATLFTPRLHGDHFVCSAINLSEKTLGVDIAILNDSGNGQLLAPVSGDANPTGKVSIHPGAEAEINFSLTAGMADDGYCEVTVSGTGNRDDVRVEMDVHWTRTVPGLIPGTTFPHLQDLVVQGY